MPFLKGTVKDYIFFLLICQDKRKKEKNMFENTIAYKRIMKRKLLTEAVEKAKEEGIDWKIR